MKRSTLLFLAAMAALYGSAQGRPGGGPQGPVSFVDPYIGTAAHGHVFLGASVPFGAVQAGPDNINKGWDWCSGYHYSDSVVKGFSLDHLSGTGIPDLGDVLIMPYTGTVRTDVGTQQDPGSGYAARYRHADEVVRPAYYSLLKSDGVKVELTASERVAFHRYTFPAGRAAHVIIDLQQGNYSKRMKLDKVAGYLRKVDDHTLLGWRNSSGWAADRRVYFAVRSNVPLSDFVLYEGDSVRGGKSLEAKIVKGLISFKKTPRTVLLKIGMSPVSSEHALANIGAEIPGWDFGEIVRKGEQKWNAALSSIAVRTRSDTGKRIFYTALYHTMIAPSLYNDADGSYRGTDKKVYGPPGFDNYTIFSLWDTYRGLHPLMSLLQPKRTADFVNSMLAIYRQQGKLPIWHLQGNETNCMVGYSAVPVIADALLNGIGGFDQELAFEAMKASSTRDDFGMRYIKESGYIPADKEVESVSKALEYALSDWCIAQVARRLNKEDDYRRYSARAQYYRRYFDTTTRFVRGVMADGRFRTPFNPVTFDYKAYDFTEGTSWQYTWLVPQDVEGLIALMGGDDAFGEKLDSLFLLKESLGKDAPDDISGLVGLYAQGNEPNHHIPYLYAFAGQQWKTAEKVRRIAGELYTTRPDGLCGNDDCGQMSAWYVLAALGFYPVNPANGVFVLGSPLLDEAVIRVGAGGAAAGGDAIGHTFTVRAINNSAANKYIQRARLNGKVYTKSYIDYRSIMKGGVLELAMGPEPNKEFGKAPADRPATGPRASRGLRGSGASGEALGIADLDIRMQTPVMVDSNGLGLPFKDTVEIKKIRENVYYVRVGLSPAGACQPVDIVLPLTIGVKGMDAVKRVFHWAPNLERDGGGIMSEHVFRSPCLVLCLEKKSLVFIPDITEENSASAAPRYFGLHYGEKAVRIEYGLSDYRVVRHQYYTKSNRPFSLDRPLELGFYLLVSPDTHRLAALRAANGFLWTQYASAYTRSCLPQTLVYPAYAEKGYGMALEHYWVAGPAADKGGITLATYYDEATKKYGGRFYKNDLWYHSWFNNTRTAYGLYYWGVELGKKDWQEKARACVNLILGAPADKGWFPTIYRSDSNSWIASGQGGGPGLYHMPDNAWTAYWVMRFNDELCPVRGAEAFVGRFGAALLASQNGDGSFPARVHTGTLLADTILQSSASSAMATWYLEALLLRGKMAPAVVAGYRRSILRSLEFLDKQVLPDQRFEDFELYFSCSPKPMHYFDTVTNLYGQNTLSIQWCAEAYLCAYRLFGDSHYLRQGEYCLNILSLYQQVWNPPFIHLYAFGGFGVQNTDAEWSDARQAQFAETYLDYYRATGRREYLERAVYACKASFALMVLPENKTVCPENYQGTEINGESWVGAMAENYGHSGYAARSYQSGFHWGTGSALTSAAILKQRLGDLYVGSGFVLGVDGIVVDTAFRKGNVLHVHTRGLPGAGHIVRKDAAVKERVVVDSHPGLL